MTLRELASAQTPRIRRVDWYENEFLTQKKINGSYFYYDEENVEIYPFSVLELHEDIWEECHDKEC